MSSDAPILVATESVADARLVTKLLSDDFDNIFQSTAAESAVADFENHRPVVLILAFDSLDQAQRYYLGLYRLSSAVHTIPHRTLILCHRKELWEVFELCKKRHFDDYILFWPTTSDVPRLRMAVHHALRQMKAIVPDGVTPVQFAAHARGMAGLESGLNRYAAAGSEHLDLTAGIVAQAERDIGASLEVFSRKLVARLGEDPTYALDAARLRREIARLKSEEIDQHMRSVSKAVNAVRQWAGTLDAGLAPHLEAARALHDLAQRVRPVVLIVDDDAFQRRLLEQSLRQEAFELMFAASGLEALATLHSRRPDLILMDVNLSDLNGIDTTRRLKSIEQFADIPVLMITGQSDKQVVVDSLHAGAADFIVKPFDKDTLLAKMHGFLQQSAHRATR